MRSNINIFIKILLFWYIFIFISTEILSLFNILNRTNILILNLFFLIISISLAKSKIASVSKNLFLKSSVSKFILLILVLTFIQGFTSAPSTTDSMVYHIPRIMYWMQEKTIFQDVIRNNHDFMPPFAEFIQLHLYQVFGNDRLLFFSQWLAYAASIYLSGLISIKIGIAEKMIKYIQLIVATLPIAVLQASSTQTDMVTTVFVMLSLYVTLCLLEDFSFENLFFLGVALGLGSLVKSSFYIFSIIPLGYLMVLLIKRRQMLKISLILIPLCLALIIQIPFFAQNLKLYGSIFGTRLIEQDSVYSNEEIKFNVTVSNLIRNIFTQIPFPLINIYIENEISNIHEFIKLPINSSKTTFENSAFHVLQIIFPQEDIAGNPLHLFLIFFAGLYLTKHFKKVINKETVLFGMSVFSLIIFSSLFKWQQQHPRLEMPFLIIGSIASVKILDQSVVKNKIFHLFLIFSSFLAIIFVIFNVSHPYISYSFIERYVKQFSTPMSVIPESFISKPRTMQYFNSRYYWFEPYQSIVKELPANEKFDLSLDLKDGFEYPFLILLKESNLKYRLIPLSLADSQTIIISTTETPNLEDGYNSLCFETTIKYGFACILKKII